VNLVHIVTSKVGDKLELLFNKLASGQGVFAANFANANEPETKVKNGPVLKTLFYINMFEVS
jgi:hypothetical protein